jgi:hypothetical protein
MVIPEPAADCETQDDGQDHLNRRADQGDIAHRLEVAEGEFQAKSEEQQGDPDFSQEFDIMDLGDGDSRPYEGRPRYRPGYSRGSGAA